MMTIQAQVLAIAALLLFQSEIEVNGQLKLSFEIPR
jgi:hypothetical protein